MHKHNFELPTFIYFLGAALCLGGAGGSCEYLSRELPAGNCTAFSVGTSCGFILFSIYLIVMGICRWRD